MARQSGEPKKKRGTLTTKEGVAKLSIFAVSLLIVMKVVASIVTGSIGIRADAVHSVIDLVGVVIGFIAVKVAGKPPDERHTFGHGKAENIAGFIIAGLIFVAAGTITYDAVKRLIFGGTVEFVTVGIYVIAAAIVINVIVSWWALRVARSTDSLALEATGQHLLADVLSSVAVLVGLILVRLTGISLLDPIAALLVAILIARSAYTVIRKSFGGLMDTKLPEAEVEVIKSAIIEHSSQAVGFHALRTRKAGGQRYIDLHLVMPKRANVVEAHRMCDHLEQDIKNRLQNSSVIIHVEPCDEKCDHCYVTCSLRQARR